MQRICLGRSSRYLLRTHRVRNLKLEDVSHRLHRRSLYASLTNGADVSPLRKELKDANKASRVTKGSGSAFQPLPEEVLSQWELTVGIEIHAQLNTARKLFSRSPSENEERPNRNISPFDISLPGSLPAFQPQSLIPALRAAIALNCQIQQVSRFDRKHYFYHDQPAGYQITQYYQPFAKDGSLALTKDDSPALTNEDKIEIGIKQIQLEQDTAKTQELEDGTSLIDFTRSGQPLIEIISLPEIHSPEVAAAYMRKIQALLYSIDAVTTGMELGGLRADINVSVRRIGDPQPGASYGGVSGLGQRTEIKNLSSFKAVEDAVKAERDRQIRILEAGGVVHGETRGWSVTTPNETRRLRGKEGEVDYRYMPDPDVPPLYIANDLITYLRNKLPRTPDQLSDMLVNQYGLSLIDAKTLILLNDGERLHYFQLVVRGCTEDPSEYSKFGKVVINWVLHELGSLFAIKEIPWSGSRVTAPSLGEIIMLVEQEKITNISAKRILQMVFDGDERSIDDIVQQERFSFTPMSDAEYSDLADKVLQDHPDVIRDIQDKGKTGKIQFLIGQMMRSGDRSRMEATKAGSVLQEKLLHKDP